VKKTITVEEEHRYCDFCDPEKTLVDNRKPCVLCESDICNVHTFYVETYEGSSEGTYAKRVDGWICPKCDIKTLKCIREELKEKKGA
jgi:hypothetical protein